MPGGPRSPRSPLGPGVPLHREQMQKKGIWSIGGGCGELSSMSQMAVSEIGGMDGSGIPNARVKPDLEELSLGGHKSEGMGPLREMGNKGSWLSDELKTGPT